MGKKKLKKFKKISDKSTEAISNASVCKDELYLFIIMRVQKHGLKVKMRLDRLVSGRVCMLAVRFICDLHRTLNQSRSFAEHESKLFTEERLNQGPEGLLQII